MRIPAVDIREARGNLDVYFVLVICPATRIRYVFKQQRRTPISHHKEAADIRALIIKMPAPDLANCLVLKKLHVESVQTRQRLEHRGRDLHKALAVNESDVRAARSAAGSASLVRPQGAVRLTIIEIVPEEHVVFDGASASEEPYGVLKIHDDDVLFKTSQVDFTIILHHYVCHYSDFNEIDRNLFGNQGLV